MWLKNLFKADPPSTLLLLMRDPVPFSLEWAVRSMEPHWPYSLSDRDLYWNASGEDGSHALALDLDGTTVNLWHRTPATDSDAADDDKPDITARRSWPPYAERVEFCCYASTELSLPQRFALTVKAALPFLTGNCVAVYDSYNRRLMPASADTLAEFQRIAATLPPFKNTPLSGPRFSISLLLQRPVPLDAASLRAAVERAWQRPLPEADFWSVSEGNQPKVEIDFNTIQLAQSTAPFPPDDPKRKPVLPPPAERAGWPEHNARLTLFTDDLGMDNTARQGALARLAIGWLGEGCVGVWDNTAHAFFRSPAEAFPHLQQAAQSAPAMPDPTLPSRR